MAVDIKKTFYGWTDTELLAAGAVIDTEGQGLVAVLEDGVEKVKPATGGAGETMVGWARYRQLAFGINAKVEDNLVVPHSAPFVVELAHTNLINTPAQLRVHSVPDNADFLVVPGAPLAGQVQPDYVHGTLTFNGVADADKQIIVTYRYNLTVAEAKTTFYEAPVNYPDPNLFGQVGVGKGKGRVYTLHFDASKDYSLGGALHLGANGLVTVGGIGAVIPNARVVQIPSANDPYLGLEFLL